MKADAEARSKLGDISARMDAISRTVANTLQDMGPTPPPEIELASFALFDVKEEIDGLITAALKSRDEA